MYSLVCDFVECEVCDVIENHHHHALTFGYGRIAFDYGKFYMEVDVIDP